MKTLIAALIAIATLAGAAQAANVEPTADWKHAPKCHHHCH